MPREFHRISSTVDSMRTKIPQEVEVDR